MFYYERILLVGVGFLSGLGGVYLHWVFCTTVPWAFCPWGFCPAGILSVSHPATTTYTITPAHLRSPPSPPSRPLLPHLMYIMKSLFCLQVLRKCKNLTITPI